jgi:hypothetical protein
VQGEEMFINAIEGDLDLTPMDLREEYQILCDLLKVKSSHVSALPDKSSYHTNFLTLKMPNGIHHGLGKKIRQQVYIGGIPVHNTTLATLTIGLQVYSCTITYTDPRLYIPTR